MSDKKIRAGCKDMWNAFMVKGANFSDYCERNTSSTHLLH